MRTLVILYFASVWSGCAASARPGAVAQVAPFRDNSITGQISFTDTKDGVLVQGEISGLPPRTKHGFHVHEVADCSAPGAAKGHFNPTGHEHGAIYDEVSHIGDLGNVFADDNGVAHINVVKKGAHVKKGETGYVGHSVIVHEGTDDQKSQPSGSSGEPAACGIIVTRS